MITGRGIPLSQSFSIVRLYRNIESLDVLDIKLTAVEESLHFLRYFVFRFALYVDSCVNVSLWHLRHLPCNFRP